MVRAVQRVCAIMTLLQESSSAVPVSAIAGLTDLPPTTAFRYLWTLEAHGYIEDVGGRTFRLGAHYQNEILREAARPWLRRLRDALGETVTLGVLLGETVTYLDVAESAHRLRFVALPGDRTNLHATAIGKAIATRLSEQRAREILAQTGVPLRTRNTITTIDAYIDQVAGVRALGYAVDDGEGAPDSRCVAVPICTRLIAAALSVGAPATRLSMHEVGSVAAHLRDAANHIAGVLQDREGVDAHPPSRPRELNVTDEELAALYRQGSTLAELTERAGASAPTIRRRLVAYGVEIRPRTRWRELNVTDEELTAWYRQGSTLAELAERAGASDGTVWRRLVAQGVELHPPRRRRKLNVSDEELTAWYQQGSGLTELAERAGASRDTIRRRLVARGVEIRPPTRRRELSVPDEELADQYRKGSRLVELVAWAGATRKTIRKRLVAQGVELHPPGRQRKLSVPDEELAALYRQGSSLVELAELAGADGGTVRRRLAAYGVELRPPSRWRQLSVSDEELAARYRQGSGLVELAVRAGVGKDTIRRRVAARGVEIRAQRRQLSVTDEELAARYRQGSSLVELVAWTGATRKTVRKRLVAQRVELRPPGRQRKLSVPDEELAARYRQGSSLVELAERAGVGKDTIRTRLAAYGVEIRPRRRQLDMYDEELAARYRQGSSLVELAERAGVGKDTIRRRLAACGVEIRPPTRRRELNLSDEELAASYRRGSNLTKLAERAGASRHVVRRRLVARRVELRQPTRRRELNVSDEELAELYRQGTGLIELAQRAGVSAPTIQRRLVALGVELRPPTRRRELNLSDEELAARYRKGSSLTELAELAGATDVTVRTRLVANGVELRPRSRWRHLNVSDEELAELYRQGTGLIELAQRAGVSAPTIRERLAANGVEIRPPTRRRQLDMSDEELAALYQRGSTLAELAELVGVGRHAVRRRLAARGVEIRSSSNGSMVVPTSRSSKA